MQNDKEPKEPKSPEDDIRSQYEDERTQNRIQEHLTNEGDVITEQDIANIATDIFEPGDEPASGITNPDAVDEAQIEAEEVLAEKKVRDNEDPEIGTPWNIVS